MTFKMSRMMILLLSYYAKQYSFTRNKNEANYFKGTGFGRIFNKTSSFLSRKQDFLWPILLLIPFVTGFVCAHLNVSPANYTLFMLMHVLSGDLIFLLIPFTKIAHCVLMPLSQVICTLAWKFPADTDDKICTTLNKKGAPV